MIIHVIAKGKLVWFVSPRHCGAALQNNQGHLWVTVGSSYTHILKWIRIHNKKPEQGWSWPGQKCSTLINCLYLLHSKIHKANRCFNVKSSHQYKRMVCNTPDQRPVPLPRPNGPNSLLNVTNEIYLFFYKINKYPSILNYYKGLKSHF